MPLYHFYRLVNNVDEVCYIGMTRSELRKRLYGHRSPTSTCSSKQLIEKYGRENVSIVLIHSLEFATNEEAHREERRLIEEYRGRCVNLVIPYRSVEEVKERKKAIYEAHAEEVKARSKAYREVHTEKQKEYMKTWYEANKEEEKARSKAYREAHKEQVKAQKKAYREAHTEETKARKKAWYEANKEAILAKQREARAKAKALKSEPTVVEDNES